MLLYVAKFKVMGEKSEVKLSLFAQHEVKAKSTQQQTYQGSTCTKGMQLLKQDNLPNAWEMHNRQTHL